MIGLLTVEGVVYGIMMNFHTVLISEVNNDHKMGKLNMEAKTGRQRINKAR